LVYSYMLRRMASEFRAPEQGLCFPEYPLVKRLEARE
jgi:hypothetical protein